MKNKKTNKTNKIHVVEAQEDPETANKFTDEELDAFFIASDDVIEACMGVSETLGGDSLDTVELIAMALGRFGARAKMPRGLLMEYLLSWYELEQEAMEEEDPNIEVELETPEKGKNGVN